MPRGWGAFGKRVAAAKRRNCKRVCAADLLPSAEQERALEQHLERDRRRLFVEVEAIVVVAGGGRSADPHISGEPAAFLDAPHEPTGVAADVHRAVFFQLRHAGGALCAFIITAASLRSLSPALRTPTLTRVAPPEWGEIACMLTAAAAAASSAFFPRFGFPPAWAPTPRKSAPNFVEQRKPPMPPQTLPVGFSESEVHGDEIVRVVRDSRHRHCVTAAHALLRRLKDEAYFAAQPLICFHKHLRQGEADGGVSVVSAGVRPAGIHGGKPRVRRKVFRVARLFGFHTVDVEAKECNGVFSAGQKRRREAGVAADL